MRSGRNTKIANSRLGPMRLPGCDKPNGEVKVTYLPPEEVIKMYGPRLQDILPKSEFERLRKQGLRLDEIAKMFGIGKKQIRYLANKYQKEGNAMSAAEATVQNAINGLTPDLYRQLIEEGKTQREILGMFHLNIKKFSEWKKEHGLNDVKSSAKPSELKVIREKDIIPEENEPKAVSVKEEQKEVSSYLNVMRELEQTIDGLRTELTQEKERKLELIEENKGLLKENLHLRALIEKSEVESQSQEAGQNKLIQEMDKMRKELLLKSDEIGRMRAQIEEEKNRSIQLLKEKQEIEVVVEKLTRQSDMERAIAAEAHELEQQHKEALALIQAKLEEAQHELSLTRRLLKLKL
jgi:hypothetical protein